MPRIAGGLGGTRHYRLCRQGTMQGKPAAAQIKKIKTHVRVEWGIPILVSWPEKACLRACTCLRACAFGLVPAFGFGTRPSGHDENGCRVRCAPKEKPRRSGAEVWGRRAQRVLWSPSLSCQRLPQPAVPPALENIFWHLLGSSSGPFEDGREGLRFRFVPVAQMLAFAGLAQR